MSADAPAGPQAALARLLTAYGTAAHGLIWAYDERLADLARSTTQPVIGQMRLAWWNEVIDDASGRKGQGEPLIDAMRAGGVMALPGLTAMIDGWEVMVVEAEVDAQGLRDYAAGRGGGLFQALAGRADAPEWLLAAGQVWALWDLSGHVGDPALADAALALAKEGMPEQVGPWPRAWRPLRIAYTLARQDVLAGRTGPVGMPRRLALRLLRIALVGR